MSAKDEYPKRKRTYNEQVEVNKISIRIRRNKTQVVLKDVENNEYTYKLVKDVKKIEKDKSLGLEIAEEETEQVKKEEINKHLPEVFKLIAEYLKKNNSIVLNLSYSSIINLDDEEQEYQYNFFFESDVQTIYSNKLFKSDERLQELIKKADNNKKGVEVGI